MPLPVPNEEQIDDEDYGDGASPDDVDEQNASHYAVKRNEPTSNYLPGKLDDQQSAELSFKLVKRLKSSHDGMTAYVWPR